MLNFDAPTHTYTWKGTTVPSVTQVLDATLNSYNGVPKETLEHARLQGTAIHRAIELHVAGKLAHCPTWLEAYVLAWEAFVRDTGFELEASERRMYHPLAFFAGTADLFGWMQVRKQRHHLVIDLKRSFCAGAAIGLQTAAYKALYNYPLLPADKSRVSLRFALRFKPGQSPPYQLQEYTEIEDFSTFLAMLNVYRWRLANA